MNDFDWFFVNSIFMFHFNSIYTREQKQCKGKRFTESEAVVCLNSYRTGMNPRWIVLWRSTQKMDIKCILITWGCFS